jgi:hypothetical protein
VRQINVIANRIVQRAAARWTVSPTEYGRGAVRSEDQRVVIW